MNEKQVAVGSRWEGSGGAKSYDDEKAWSSIIQYSLLLALQTNDQDLKT
jgi:hypothetical protein